MNRQPTRMVSALLSALLAPAAMAQSDFATWVGYDTGTGSTARHPYDSAVGDFDRDGDPDLAVVNWWSYPSMGVLYNNGDGTYSDPVQYPGTPSYGVVVSDFNGDGWDDIMAANHGQNGSATTVSLYRNARDGTFLPRQRFQAGPGPLGLAAADFDGDGDFDVAVANNRIQSTTVSLLLNNGNGEFAPPVAYEAAPQTTFGAEPAVVAAADLNGDGLPDLAVGNDNQYVTVLFNTGGAFGPPSSQSTMLGANAGFYPSIAVDDIDRDGDLDVLYSNTLTQVLITSPRVTFAGAVAVFRNDGTGTLAPAEGHPTALATIGFADMALADFNGDGWTDIAGVWQANGGWGVSLNDGAGNFQLSAEYASGDEPMCISAADVDGDADPDAIVVAREALMAAVHRNPGDGEFSIAPVFAAGFLTNRRIDSADIDGDGDLDVASCWAANNRGGIEILMNDGSGVLGPAVSYPSLQAADGVKLGDLNGDGFPDLAWADDTLTPPYNFWTRLNKGDGTFGPARNWLVGTCGTWDLELMDLDNDGDLDVVLCEFLACFGTLQKFLYARLNRGDGTFARPYLINGDQTGTSDAVGGDFDEDGLLDIVNASVLGLNFLRGTGGGQFDAPVPIAISGSTDRMVTADLNGDGHLDLVVTGREDVFQLNGVHILLGDGNGGFAPATHYLGNYSGVRFVETGDADSDGDLDVLIGNITSNDVSLYRNNGDGTFEEQIRYGAAGGPIDLTFGDFTGDGVGDVAVVMGDTVSYYNNGAGVQVLHGLPRCAGSFSSYGSGLPGSGNRTPFHSGSGCPTPGAVITLGLTNGRANAPASLFFGSDVGSVPILGGTFLLGGAIAGLPVQLDRDGAFSLSPTIPLLPGLAGATIYTQAAVADPGALRGVAFSAGLATTIR